LDISDFGLRIQIHNPKTILEFRIPHSQIRNRDAPLLQQTHAKGKDQPWRQIKAAFSLWAIGPMGRRLSPGFFLQDTVFLQYRDSHAVGARNWDGEKVSKDAAPIDINIRRSYQTIAPRVKEQQSFHT
jgi:hypothetical protein